MLGYAAKRLGYRFTRSHLRNVVELSALAFLIYSATGKLIQTMNGIFHI